MLRQDRLQPIGPCVGMPRAAPTLAGRDSGTPPAPAGATHASRDPDLQLEGKGGIDLAPRPSRIGEAAVCSIVVHAVGLTALAAVPLLLSSAMPHPAEVVRAFFAEPMVAPPPPPPPLAAPRTVDTEPPAPAPSLETFAAPVEIPSALRPEDGLDLGIEGGITSGVEGGAPGGVVGGVVGGLPDVSLPPPPMKPVRAGLLVRRPMKVKHVAPVYPVFAANARLQGVVVIEAVIDERGRVAEAKLLRGMPLLSEAVLVAVRQWVYTPTLFNGVPTPVRMTITVKFELGKASDPSVS
jgi:protein TonB